MTKTIKNNWEEFRTAVEIESLSLEMQTLLESCFFLGAETTLFSIIESNKPIKYNIEDLTMECIQFSINHSNT